MAITYKYQEDYVLNPGNNDLTIVHRMDSVTGDVKCVPVGVQSHYSLELQEWIDEGNTPDDYDS